ncbi:hypothetical protein LTA6_003093 [Microbacterium sp. LTA6]|uniref:hypothetical protein n=1 Tax=unclassified Microbacterium TaxID=2609290 RepID=UPI003138CA0A
MDNGSFLFAFIAVPFWLGLAAGAVVAVFGLAFGLVFAINSLIGAVISGLIASHRARRANR